MLSPKLSVVPARLPFVAALLACAFVISACSSTPKDPTANWSPNKIYSEARDEMNAGAYDKAISTTAAITGGSVTAGGIGLTTHKHTGVTTGSGTSTGPVA